eukprot:jgi/Mesen1/9127/ME000058S08622
MLAIRSAPSTVFSSFCVTGTSRSVISSALPSPILEKQLKSKLSAASSCSDSVAFTPVVKTLGRFVSGRQCTVTAMAYPSTDLEVFGKAKSGSGSPSDQRGDCPFSHRIYIDLEEKGLNYKATYIEEGNSKPQWFMEKNPSGLMPVLRDGEKWIQDSDKIADYLETKFPQPPLKTPENLKEDGMGLFQAFTKWLQAKDANNKEAKEAYVKELEKLEAHFQKNGPYVAGDTVTESDAALAPKLLHARVALEHYYGFKMPSNLVAVKNYIELIENRPSFKKTTYPNDMIVEGWKKKFELPDSMVPQEQHA